MTDVAVPAAVRPEAAVPLALSIQDVSHRYGERQALSGVSFAVRPGQIYGLLGPNGSGKSTLFKLLSTIIKLQSGRVSVFGRDLDADPAAVRRTIGVVFQQPALDKQLTVQENLQYHAKLYGLGRSAARDIDALLGRFDLGDRRKELVASLSGGMRRKVELAKAILTRPRLLLLDEPSTGLDVAARIELWRILTELRAAGEMTVLLTTHLMDEADRCDRLAILDQGKLLADATPDTLKDQVGGDVITFTGPQLDVLQRAVQATLGVTVQRVEQSLRIERPAAHLFVPQLIEAAPGLIESVTVGRPTLDDVFVRLTGRRLHRPASDQ